MDAAPCKNTVHFADKIGRRSGAILNSSTLRRIAQGSPPAVGGTLVSPSVKPRRAIPPGDSPCLLAVIRPLMILRFRGIH